MLYLANPCSSDLVIAAMLAGTLGWMDSARQQNRRPSGVTWAADNGCFSARWNQRLWWGFLTRNRHDAARCLFAVAPDVVADAQATRLRSAPWMDAIRELGYPVAYVAQDGAEEAAHAPPWPDLDVLFVGGSTAWKLGPEARQLVQEAHDRGKRVHVGRVNSGKRYRYAEAIGADSCDGTFLTYAPDANLVRLREWSAQGGLWP